jgi:putative transposase
MSSLTQRKKILAAIDEAVGNGARLRKACDVISIAASTLRRWRTDNGEIRQDLRPSVIRPEQEKQLSAEEQQRLLETINRPEYSSLPPSQIVPALAGEGLFYGSESTIYRLMKKNGSSNHRGRAKTRQKKSPPRTHIAEAINQVWMVDITFLPSRVKGQFYYLYMVEDLYSRYGVHWEVYTEENSEHTCRVIEQSMWREKCLLNPPTLYRDNGSTLKSQTVRQKMYDMGISSSPPRPRVSNDNAFVESLFRTLKYCPRGHHKALKALKPLASGPIDSCAGTTTNINIAR